MNRILFLVGLLAVGLSAQAATPYSDWQHSGKFYIITTPEGADLPASATESNFPLLVRLNSGNFNFGEAQPNGEDIRFESGTGTPLAYQIEQWDPAGDAASVWVRIPTINGNARQEVKMFWGKAGAASESNGKAVFNESNGYVCVFHMNDPVKDDAGTLEAKDTGTTSSSGVIGKSRRLDVGKGVNCGESITTLPTGSNPHSTELWIRPEKSKVVPVAWGNEEPPGGRVSVNFQRGILLDCYFSKASVASKSPLGLSQWIQVVHTYMKGESRVYVNGVLAGESNDGENNIQTPARMYIGGWYGHYNFVGDIDEVRVSKVTRSADWVKMQYENQKPMQMLVGPLVAKGNDFSLSPSSLVIKEGQRVDITATAGGAQKLYWILKSGDKEEVVAVDRFRLPFDAGRVETNTSRVLRLKAIYPGETKTKDVAISITEAIPSPDFTVDAPATWDGCTPITVSAKMANLEQMRAKGAGELHYSWKVSGLATLTEIATDTLTLKRAHLSGPLTITLSVHNGGVPTIRSAIINVSEPTTRATVPAVLKADTFKHHVDKFNAEDEELYVNNPNALAWQFIVKNAPLFECPDKDIEQTYYFRWWTLRKHIKLTPDGFVITEFLPVVPWAGKHNAISCPAGHHYYEGRWLHDTRYLDDYSLFWLRKDGNPRGYSFWIADAFYARQLVTPNKEFLVDLLEDLIKNYGQWEANNRDKNGLYRQIDDRDGMECSIGGSGYRATINSYMYGDAVAIARIAMLAGRKDVAGKFVAKAKEIKNLVQTKLWDSGAQFFKVLPVGDNKSLVDVRELHGYTPWYFNLPDKDKGYEVAWKQLMDPKGFFAPFGPTTAEQRHPKFAINYTGHGCQWNGPSWPFATAVTLTAMANVLHNYGQSSINKDDYFRTLKSYAMSHHRKLDDARVVSWIDENIDPFTGVWIARKFTAEHNADSVKNGQPDEVIYERGKDYNHSSFCDLIITGLVGLRPRADDVVEVHPLVPDGKWDWFCLDNVLYHGRTLTILWDKTGTKYGKGQGLRVLADGKEIAMAKTLTRVIGQLPRTPNNKATRD